MVSPYSAFCALGIRPEQVDRPYNCETLTVSYILLAPCRRLSTAQVPDGLQVPIGLLLPYNHTHLLFRRVGVDYIRVSLVE